MKGINLTGFRYPLHDATLRIGESLGISNVLEAEKGIIRVARGRFAVYQKPGLACFCRHFSIKDLGEGVPYEISCSRQNRHSSVRTLVSGRCRSVELRMTRHHSEELKKSKA